MYCWHLSVSEDNGFAPWSLFRGRAATATVAVEPNPRAAGLLAGGAHKGFVVQGIRCCPHSSVLPFILCCSFSFCSILTAADFLVNLHTFRSAVKASRSVGSISPALRSRLQISLYRRVGLPAGLEPVASSPYSCQHIFWYPSVLHL